ncbi:UNVERIFIED_CONTAM: hypothetical protein HDU68_002861 [Siphonaria sp. JEL0065]|nr:hypothetical protein HDU68_002861 [Siphonaria sp. JEL0065]
MDCNAKMPSMICLNTSTFVCARCAGLLRTLNFRIKSLSSSTFSLIEVNALSKNGNGVARKSYLATHNPAIYPIPDQNDDVKLVAFMKEKYVHKTWFSAETVQLGGDVVVQPKKLGVVMMADSSVGSAGNVPVCLLIHLVVGVVCKLMFHVPFVIKVLAPQPSFGSFSLPPPPSHSRPIGGNTVKAPSVDDLFGLDFGANFTTVAPPVTPAPSVSVAPSVISSVDIVSIVAETLSEPSAVRTLEVTPEATPVVIQQEKIEPIVAVVGQEIVEPIAIVDANKNETIADETETKTKQVTVAESTTKPSNDLLFSWDEPVEPAVAIASSTPNESNTTPSADFFSIENDNQDAIPINFAPLQFTTSTPIPTAPTNPPASIEKQGPKDTLLFEFIQDAPFTSTAVNEADSHSGMGSLLEMALQRVVQKPEDLLVDLKSLDLNGGGNMLVDVLVRKQEEEEVVQEDVIARAAEQEELESLSQPKPIDILKDLDDEDFEYNGGFGRETVVVPVAPVTLTPAFESIDVMDNPWG